MEKNTVDVLFLGSSHAASSFSPQKLYNEYGICSYNLGCEQQNLVVSYYWLREALRYQKPKAVILDCYMLFPYNKEEALNTSEACTRKAIDYMRWSSVKREAVKEICRLDEKQSAASYYLPNIRFHTRWTALNEDDFTISEMRSHYELKGYTALSASCGIETFQPFEGKNSETAEEMVALMKEYLNKIEELCRQEKIELILVKTPATPETVKRYNAIKEYAKEKKLRFFDFNERTLYEALGFQLSLDNNDGGHGNLWGAEKITSYLGRILREDCGIEGRTDRQWEDTKGYYEGVIKDCNIKKETCLEKYLELVKDERYIVLMAVKDEASQALSAEALEGLRALGLSGTLEGKPRYSYYALLSKEQILEEAGEKKLEKAGTLRGGRISYEIQSAGYECGNVCSICIGGKEYAKNKRGLNIVVYNTLTKNVVDSVCFDTHDPALTVSR